MSYTAIASQTLGSSVTSVTFSSIPGTYRDLILVSNVSGSSGGGIDVNLRFNGDSGGNYHRVNMSGSGSSTGASVSTGVAQLQLSSFVALQTTATWVNVFQVFDYAQTNKHKSALWRTNEASTWGTEAMTGRWASTAAITSIVLSTSFGDFTSGSTFSLYGVSA